jgi:hypothetical protein
MPLEDMFWGDRRYEALDLEGTPLALRRADVRDPIPPACLILACAKPGRKHEPIPPPGHCPRQHHQHQRSPAAPVNPVDPAYPVD